MKTIQKTLDKLDQTGQADGGRWVAATDQREVDGRHTVSPIDLAKDSVAATRHHRTIVNDNGRWLMRLGLWELVCGMIILSEAYGFPWKAIFVSGTV